MAFHEPLLYRVELGLFQALNRADLAAVGHHGKRGAGLDRRVVKPDGAGAAVGGVASPVAACKGKLIADEVDEQQARLDVPGVIGAVDVDRDAHG